MSPTAFLSLAHARQQLTINSTVLVVNLLDPAQTHRGQVASRTAGAFTLDLGQGARRRTPWPKAADFDPATGTVYAPEESGQPRRRVLVIRLLERYLEPTRFDLTLYPGPAFVHFPDVPVPPYQPLQLTHEPDPSPQQHQDLHELAHLAHRAGYQLVLTRLNCHFPLCLTTFRYGQAGAYLQWSDTEAATAGQRLRTYLEGKLAAGDQGPAISAAVARLAQTLDQVQQRPRRRACQPASQS